MLIKYLLDKVSKHKANTIFFERIKVIHFVFKGALVQLQEKSRGSRRKFTATFSGKNVNDKKTMRQCFLFSNHLILATRQSDDDGRLNLVPQIGKIPLCDAILIEDPSDQSTTDDDGQ